MDKTLIKNMIKLAFPVMIASMLQVFLGSVDLFFISKYGRDASSAAAMGGGMSGAIFIFSMLISSGLTPIVAQNYGAKKTDTLKRYAKKGMILSVVVGTIVMLLALKFNSRILKLMYNPTKDVLDLTIRYLNIIYLSTVFVFLNGTMRSIFHALSDTVTPLIVMVVSNVLNGVLDYIFVIILGKGIEGAAVATVISIVLSTFILYAFYKRHIKNLPNSSESEIVSGKAILKIGFWSMLQQLARPITGLIMYRLVFEIGQSIATAAFGIGGQVLNYTFILLSGLSVAISVMTGQIYGEGRIEEIKKITKNGMILCFVNVIVFMIPYFLFADSLMRFFINDPLVIKEGINYLFIVYLGILIIPITTVLGGVYLGIGKTAYPFWASFSANVVLKVPLAYMLSKYLNLGTNGIWLSIAASIWIESLIMLVNYFKRKGEIFNVKANF